MEHTTELMKTLDEELSLCSELLYVTRAQKPAIISGDVLGLAELVSRAEKTIRRLRDVEVSWAELASRFALESDGKPADDPEAAVAALVASLGDAHKTEFQTIKSRIAGLLDDIASANAVNEGLLRDALSYIDNTVRLIAGAEGDNSIYSRLGILDKKASLAAVDETA
ncbi:MAG: flagellar protein FlgN [Bacillota bacterium]